MTICRFSNDNMTSDVYAYYDMRLGYVVCVAANRLSNATPCPSYEAPGIVTSESVTEAHKAHSRALRAWFAATTRAPIDLPWAGEVFTSKSSLAAEEFLLNLRRVGYHVPERAFTCLKEHGTCNIVQTTLHQQ